jgi:hypothetical protein
MPKLWNSHDRYALCIQHGGWNLSPPEDFNKTDVLDIGAIFG